VTVRHATSIALTCLVVGLAGVAHAQESVQEISLDIGEQTTVPAEGVRSYSEGTPGIVDIRITRDGAQFVVVALQPGTTTLLLIMRDGSTVRYNIEVRPPPTTERPGAVERRENIRLDVYFVQLDESSNLQVGLGLPGSVTAEGRLTTTLNLTAGGSTSTAVITAEALPRLDFLHATGWARVMRHVAVVTANGSQASFGSGGEFNVVVEGGITGGQLQSIPFGSNISMSPRFDPQTGRLDLQVTAEVADLSDSGAGAPGRTVTRLTTIVNLELGESIVLGGLQSETDQNSKRGFPFLSQIPILGILFGSHAERTQRTENVMVIVPTVVESIAARDRALIAETLRTYRDYRGDIEEEGGLLPPPAERGVPASPEEPGAR
jgi:pilus assembly protein CpaC